MNEAARTLMDAIRSGDRPTAERVLEDDLEVASAVDEQGVSLLLQAFYHRQVGIAELIASARDQHGLPVDAFEAAVLGRLDRLRECLGSGMAIEERSRDGFGLLHLAAFFGQEPVLAYLIEAGADVHAVAENPSRVQPLHSAAAAQGVGACQRLLAAGAQPDGRQAGGFTPLMSAALQGNRPLVELLLEHGAIATRAADDGRTARDLALDRGHGEIAALLERSESA